MIKTSDDYDKLMRQYLPIYEKLAPQTSWMYQDRYPVDSKKCQVVILCESPSSEDCTVGHIGTGPISVILDVALNFANIRKDECHITHVFPFKKPKQRQWKVGEVDYVAPFVRERLKKFRIVIALGKASIRVYDTSNVNVNDQCGDVVSYTHSDGMVQQIVYSIGPGYVVKGYTDPSGESSAFWYLVLALKNAKDFLDGKDIFSGTNNHKASLIVNKDSMRDYLHAIPKGQFSTVDFEATSTNPYLTSLPLCVGMSNDGINSMTLAFYPWFPYSNISFSDYLSALKEADQFSIIMHNMLYDYSLMTRFGYDGRPPAVDTMYLYHSGYEFLPKSLKFLSSFFCKIRPYAFSFATIEPYLNNKCSFEDAETLLTQLLHYCGLDAIATWLLYQRLPIIAADDWARISVVYYKYIHKLLLALHETQRDGLILNQTVLQPVRNNIKNTLQLVEKNIKTLLPGVDNVRSNPQLGVAFKPIVKKFPNLYKPNKQGISLTGDILLELSEQHKIAPAKELLKYRKLNKLLSTYVDSYPQYLDAAGLIHTQFGLAKTSRLKSSDPALQTLPRKSVILSLFTADFGLPPYDHIFIKSDYSAAEARLLAFFCGIEKLLDPTVDVHVLSATIFFEVLKEQVTSDMRQKTKNLTFGTIYGASAARIAKLVYGVVNDETKSKAQELLDLFLLVKFPEIKQFMVNRESDIKSKGFIEMSKVGLRRHFPVECFAKKLITEETHGSSGIRFSKMIFAKAIREGYNYLPQGGVAYLTNKALMDLRERYKKVKWKTEMPSVNLQYHDALVVRSHKDDFVQAVEIKKEVMLEPSMGPIIPIDMQIGWNLKDCIEIVASNDSIQPLNWDDVMLKVSEVRGKAFEGIREFVWHSLQLAKKAR